MNRYEQFHNSMTLILAELQKIEHKTNQLLHLYSEAEQVVDLTFIKKIQEHYANLFVEVSAITSSVSEEQDRLTSLIDLVEPVEQIRRYA